MPASRALSIPALGVWLALWPALPAHGAPAADGAGAPEPAPVASAERPSPWIDAAITVGAAGGWLGLHLAGPSLVDPRCPCTPDDAPAFERFAIKHRLSWGEPLADGLFAAGMGLTLAAALAGPAEHRWHDALIVAQSAALAGLLTAGLKAAVGRPYPYMFGPAPYPGQNGDGVNYASFPSGHTAVPMAAAVSAAVLFERRHPRSGWRWVLWTVGPALALAAGAAQVSAANHFPSDVLAGAAIGAGVGLLDPWLHDL